MKIHLLQRRTAWIDCGKALQLASILLVDI